jgi:hypothetical protein
LPYFVSQWIPLRRNLPVACGTPDVPLLEAGAELGAIAGCALHELVEEPAAVALRRHAVEEAYCLFGEGDGDSSLHDASSHSDLTIHTNVCMLQFTC